MRPHVLLFVLLAACIPSLDDDTAVDDDSTADDDSVSDDDSVTDDDSVMDDDSVGDDDTDPGDDDSVMDDDSVGDDDSVDECSPESLGLSAWAATAGGAPATVFIEQEPVTLYAALTSSCGEALTFETPSGCLFEPWSFESSAGWGEGMGCDDAITTWTVEPFGEIVQSWERGLLDPADYIFAVGFRPNEQLTTVAFSVLGPVIGVRAP